jgi:acyl-coenzyme A synthetase/AMP-(fatty) acid ligase
MIAYITAAFSGFEDRVFTISPMPLRALKIRLACSRLTVMLSAIFSSIGSMDVREFVTVV